ncbi:MAG TPA: hypothetical protein VF874_05245 [Mycobacterium sp.]
MAIVRASVKPTSASLSASLLPRRARLISSLTAAGSSSLVGASLADSTFDADSAMTEVISSMADNGISIRSSVPSRFRVVAVHSTVTSAVAVSLRGSGAALSGTCNNRMRSRHEELARTQASRRAA